MDSPYFAHEEYLIGRNGERVLSGESAVGVSVIGHGGSAPGKKPTGYADESGAWSPDGQVYAHVFLDDSRSLWLYRAKLDSWVEQAPLLGGRKLSNPAWLSDEEVAFVWPASLGTGLGASIGVSEEPQSEPGRGVLSIISLDGSEPRQIRLDKFPKCVRATRLTRSKSGSLLAVAAAGESDCRVGTEITSLLIVDSPSGTIVGQRQLDLGPSGRYWAPQWRDDGKAIAISLGGKLKLISVEDTGSIGDVSDVDGPVGVMAATWMPGSTRLLAFSQERAPDAIEGLETIATMGEGGRRRYEYKTWMVDGLTGHAEECVGLRTTARESWNNPFMVPGVGEAMARWKQ